MKERKKERNKERKKASKQERKKDRKTGKTGRRKDRKKERKRYICADAVFQLRPMLRFLSVGERHSNYSDAQIVHLSSIWVCLTFFVPYKSNLFPTKVNHVPQNLGGGLVFLTYTQTHISLIGCRFPVNQIENWGTLCLLSCAWSGGESVWSVIQSSPGLFQVTCPNRRAGLVVL